MKQKIQNHFSGNYQTFYSKYLKDVKKAGGSEYQALCPFPSHGDTKPSFNFNNETGLYFCHGCNKKGNAFHFFAKTHGLDDRRDFPKILKGIASDFGIPWEEEKKRIAKTYDYCDAQGQLLYQVVRLEPKDFRQRRPNGRGNWVWNLKGIQPVLYNLAATTQASEVLIVEGEKDADNLISLGFIATTCPMGAKKWRDEYNDHLKGKNIVLIPDNDNEGREHMTQIAMSLNGTTRSLKWIDLPRLKSKGDISDWIATFDDKTEAGERLAVMIENADPYTPPKKASLEDIILSAPAFAALHIPEKSEYLSPWLKADSISLISGWRGVGKTFFALGLCDAISKGKNFGPWECKQAVPVLYLDGEMSQRDIQDRIRDLHIDSPHFYIYSDHHANLLGLPRAHLANESWRTKMKSILIARHIKLWIVDNIASLAGGLDENKKQDWDPINHWLLELRFTGIATALLHYVNKEGGQRGTSAREDNLDISIMLKSPSDYLPEDGCRFIAYFSKSRVNTSDLPLIADTEFKLSENNGSAVWTWKGVRGEAKTEIIKLIDEGLSNKAICDTLGITKGYVSRIKKDAINDGTLSKSGKLTQTGMQKLYEDEI